MVSLVTVCAVSVDGSSEEVSSAYTYRVAVVPIGFLYTITAESVVAYVFTRSYGGTHARAVACYFTESNQ